MKLINIKLQIGLPFRYFNHLGYIRKGMSKCKMVELEHYLSGDTLINFSIHQSIKEDHWGFECTLGLLCYIIHFHIYDIRHFEK